MAKINFEKLSLNELTKLQKQLNKAKRKKSARARFKKLKTFEYKQAKNGFAIRFKNSVSKLFQTETLDVQLSTLLLVDDIIDAIGHPVYYFLNADVHGPMAVKYSIPGVKGYIDIVVTLKECIEIGYALRGPSSALHTLHNYRIEISLSDPACFQKCKLEFDKIIQAHIKLETIMSQFEQYIDKIILL